MASLDVTERRLARCTEQRSAAIEVATSLATSLERHRIFGEIPPLRRSSGGSPFEVVRRLPLLGLSSGVMAREELLAKRTLKRSTPMISPWPGAFQQAGDLEHSLVLMSYVTQLVSPPGSSWALAMLTRGGNVGIG